MKKLASFVLITSLIGSILVGCSSNDDKTTANGEEDKVLQYQSAPGVLALQN